VFTVFLLFSTKKETVERPKTEIAITINYIKIPTGETFK